MMGWSGAGGWGFFGLPMLLWWGLIIVAIVLVVRWIAAATMAKPREEDRALAILRERYARGEIGKEEFEARKRDLG